MKFLLVAGILFAVGIPTFVFAPILSYAPPPIGYLYYTAGASPSYYFFKCGVVYNIVIVHIENFPALSQLAGAHWLCR